MEHQRVPVRIGEDRHVADAGVEDVAVELHAPLLEHRPGRRHVVDVQRDRVGIALVLHPHLLRVVDAQRQVAGLELRVVALGYVHRPGQAEDRTVEVGGGGQVMGRHADKVDGPDELRGGSRLCILRRGAHPLS